ncbi:lipopolysaccharide assembly protein LapB [Paenibacillus sp. 32352]|uniref:tetratricopeptide repeat protein n=1 Tax=Paenibacillus sp. 32352 TaxID=1969111 RepID=UPI0009AE9213|nr:tetratricopeptide repeat protein [Paenibacillus sp. 32352]
MKLLIKVALAVAALILIMIIAFRLHTLLGWGLVIVLAGAMVYVSRSSYYAIRGSSAFAADQFEQALAWYRKAYNSKPCPENHQIGYAYMLMRTGESVQAEAVLQKLLGRTGNHEIKMQASCNLATAYWLQGKRDEAVKELEDVFEQYKNTLIYGNLGYFKLMHGDLRESLEFNLAAYEFNSDDKTILDNCALNYYMLGQMTEAEALFEKLMSKSPKRAEPYYYYALTLKKLGKNEEAAEQMKQALSKDLSFLTTVTRSEIAEAAKEMNVEE